MSDSDDMANRSKKLAKDLLDGLDAPDNPDRAAHENDKTIADQQALEDFYRRTGQKRPSAAGDAAKKLAARIGAGDGTVDEQVSPHVTLRFAASPSDPDGRFVQVRVATASGGSVSSQFVARGSTAEVVAKLTSAGIAKEIEDTAEQLSHGQQLQGLP